MPDFDRAGLKVDGDLVIVLGDFEQCVSGLQVVDRIRQPSRSDCFFAVIARAMVEVPMFSARTDLMWIKKNRNVRRTPR